MPDVQDDQQTDDGPPVDDNDLPVTDTADTADVSDQPDDSPLGPKGEKALQAEKEKRRAAQRELREWKALGLTADDIKSILDERNADGDNQPDPDRIKQEARAEARAELMRERVMDKIEAKAGGRFSLDPEDVAALVLRRNDVDEFLDGDSIDVEAISDALDGLLEKSPTLAAQGGRRFEGNADGGTRKDDRPKQLTREDLKTMSPEEIVEAKAKGQLTTLLGAS